MARKRTATTLRLPTLGDGEYSFSFDNSVLRGPNFMDFHLPGEAWSFVHESTHWLQTSATSFGLLIHALAYERDRTISRLIQSHNVTSYATLFKLYRGEPLVGISDVEGRRYELLKSPHELNELQRALRYAVFDLWLTASFLLSEMPHNLCLNCNPTDSIALSFRDIFNITLKQFGLESDNDVRFSNDSFLQYPLDSKGEQLTGTSILECHALTSEWLGAARRGIYGIIRDKYAEKKRLNSFYIRPLEEFARQLDVRFEELTDEEITTFLLCLSTILWFALNPQLFNGKQAIQEVNWQDLHPGYRFIVALIAYEDFSFNELKKGLHGPKAAEYIRDITGISLNTFEGKTLHSKNELTFKEFATSKVPVHLHWNFNSLYVPLTHSSIVKSPDIPGVLFDYLIWTYSRAAKQWLENPRALMFPSELFLGNASEGFVPGGIAGLISYFTENGNFLPPLYSDHGKIFCAYSIPTSLGATLAADALRRAFLFNVAFGSTRSQEWEHYNWPGFIADNPRFRRMSKDAVFNSIHEPLQQEGTIELPPVRTGRTWLEERDLF